VSNDDTAILTQRGDIDFDSPLGTFSPALNFPTYRFELERPLQRIVGTRRLCSNHATVVAVLAHHQHFDPRPCNAPALNQGLAMLRHQKGTHDDEIWYEAGTHAGKIRDTVELISFIGIRNHVIHRGSIDDIRIDQEDAMETCSRIFIDVNFHDRSLRLRIHDRYFSKLCS